MGTLNSFIDKFGGRGEDSGTPDSTLVNASAPNALGTFLDTFSNLTESYFFYDKTVELRFNTTEHIYYRVEELGNLVPVHGVTQTLHVIDKSYALVPWAVKKAAEKLLCTIPLSDKKDEFGSFLLAPLTLEDFTKLVMTAKDAHKEILTDAGDVGHLAHKSIEDSIQHAINSTAGIVQELLNLPTEEMFIKRKLGNTKIIHQKDDALIRMKLAEEERDKAIRMAGESIDKNSRYRKWITYLQGVIKDNGIILPNVEGETEEAPGFSKGYGDLTKI